MANFEDCQIKKRADVLRKWCDGRVESIIAFDRVVEHIIDMSEHDDVDKGMGKRQSDHVEAGGRCQGDIHGQIDLSRFVESDQTLKESRVLTSGGT